MLKNNESPSDSKMTLARHRLFQMDRDLSSRTNWRKEIRIEGWGWGRGWWVSGPLLDNGTVGLCAATLLYSLSLTH